MIHVPRVVGGAVYPTIGQSGKGITALAQSGKGKVVMVSGIQSDSKKSIGHVKGAEHLCAVKLGEVLVYTAYVNLNFLAFCIKGSQVNHESLRVSILLSYANQGTVPF